MSTLEVNIFTGEETFIESPEIWDEGLETETAESAPDPAIQLAEGLSKATTIAQIRSAANTVINENT